MTESKRYRLVIPSKIKKENSHISHGLISKDGEEVKFFTDQDGLYAVSDLAYGISFSDIPKDWLQEIKEPMTFEEWRKSKYLNGEYMPINHHEFILDLKECHEWAIENFKLERGIND